MDNRLSEDKSLSIEKIGRESDKLNSSSVSEECSWETGEHHGKPYFKTGVLEGFCEQSEEVGELQSK